MRQLEALIELCAQSVSILPHDRISGNSYGQQKGRSKQRSVVSLEPLEERRQGQSIQESMQEADMYERICIQSVH